MTTTPILHTIQQEEYYPIPNRIEVIPDSDEGVEHLNGGYSRQLQSFHCEKCGYPSSRYSMYNMTFDDNGEFANRRASEDEAMLIATKLLANTSYEMWDSEYSQEEFEEWMDEHEDEGTSEASSIS